MAKHRMMAKALVLSDDFLDMPMSARCLYMTMCLMADDDGFLDAPRAIMRQVGCTSDDMKILIAKSYVIPFESGVVVIRHWRIHNSIRKDMYRPSSCKERELLQTGEDGAYYVTDSLQDRNVLVTDSLRQDKISKDKISNTTKEGTHKFVPPTLEEVRAYCQERNNNVDPEKWYAHYEAVGWKVGKNPMRNWKAAVRTWEEKKEVKVEYTEFEW